MSTRDRGDYRLRWGHGALTVILALPDGAPPSLVHLSGAGDLPDPPSRPGAPQPLVEILADGHGRTFSGARSVSTAVGQRLRYERHVETAEDGWQLLRIDTTDPETRLRVEVWLRTREPVPAIQTWTVVRNEGRRPVVLRAVSSFAASGFLPAGGGVDDLTLHWAESSWLAENRWRSDPVRALNIPDLDAPRHGYRSRGCFAVANTGSWSTKQALPTGVLVHGPTGHSWCWQVEHNGGWRWEIGESGAGVYLAASGPTDLDHQWRHVLDPGAQFTSVPVAVAASGDGLDGAVEAMTRYRRQIVRPHPDRHALPVVFNDYMNTLMGDPTSDALNPLIEAAGAAGAEYFCIDAGWHDDSRASDWYELMGAWTPSTTRFTHGLGEVIDRIRAAGMVPGLWLEPEVVGVRSPVAHQLPDEAFFQRDGQRLVEDGRYHLDLRHPAAIAHLDQVVDRLVAQFGIGMLKLDYNIDAGCGTDVKAAAPGDGLLGHNRAHLAWLDRLLDRHPTLVVENCGSGGMRMDYALLARVQLQSTSDQQNPVRYPPIAAAAPMAILPEQAGSWAYPQPEMTQEEIAFCMVTGATGRLYLSGHLDRMTPEQHALVAAGVAAYRDLRTHLRQATPCWPAGLPDWADPWVALALRPPAGSDRSTYLAVWRRPGAGAELTLRFPHLAGRPVSPTLVYPRDLDPWRTDWDAATGELTVVSGAAAPAARLYQLTPDPRDQWHLAGDPAP